VTFPSGWELILVLLVILVLFGAKRLPDSARSLGRSLRILKAETRGLRDEDDDPRDRSRGSYREDYRDTTVTAEPLPPVQPPPPPGAGYGTASGDQAQQPRP
jgi:sec-independent protein translocase protein TatA